MFETRAFQAMGPNGDHFKLMGKLDSTCTAPTTQPLGQRVDARVLLLLRPPGAGFVRRSVAVQVEFEKANFETGFSLDRLKG
jgi:hypothetical protein